MVEMKTCLATLLPNLSFQVAVPSDEITPDFQLTLGMGQGLQCFVTKSGSRKETAFSNASTTDQSHDEATLTESLGELSEKEQTSADESEIDSLQESVSEGGPSYSQRSKRERSKKRKCGWSRRRQAKFKQR